MMLAELSQAYFHHVMSTLHNFGNVTMPESLFVIPMRLFFGSVLQMPAAIRAVPALVEHSH